MRAASKLRVHGFYPYIDVPELSRVGLSIDESLYRSPVIPIIGDTKVAKRIGPKARFGVHPEIVAVLRSRCIAIAMRSSERISNDPDADSGNAELGRCDRGCRERWPGDGRPVGDDGPGPRACRRGRRSDGTGTRGRRIPEIGENPENSARGAFLRNVNFG